MSNKMWDEITYIFPNLQRWSLMDKYFHHTLYNGWDYLSMLGLNLIRVSKRGQCDVGQMVDITS